MKECAFSFGETMPLDLSSNPLATNLIYECRALFAALEQFDLDTKVETINRIREALREHSPFKSEPVDCVRWIKSEQVTANDYNPNSVAPPEMKLLEHSIAEDGYTQPIVSWHRDDVFEVVDGFHRHRVGKESATVRERVHGYLPTVVINNARNDKGDRMAATIRHNRARLVLRVNGANTGKMYSNERGNVMGNHTITLPDGHTWHSFAISLLKSTPPKTAEHYRNKIAVYIKWWKSRGYPEGIPDEADLKIENAGKAPSWRRVCKTLLRNDYWCKYLGFSPTKTSAYQKYTDLMQKRRKAWGIFAEGLN